MLAQYQYLLESPLFWLVVLVLVIGLLILLFVALRRLQEHAIVAGVHPAIISFLDEAIAIAYKVSEDTMDKLSSRLHGIEKLTIAVRVYAMLPATMTIHVAGLAFAIDWKAKVSEEVFSKLVSDRVDYMTYRFDMFEKTVLELMKAES